MSRFAATCAALAAALCLTPAARAGLAEQCSWPPPGGPAFHPESHEVEMAPIVADLDADGSPEIVIVSFADGNDDGPGHDGILRILRGSDCAELHATADVGCVTCFGDAACRSLDEIDQAGFLCPACGVSVADLDDDGDFEIVGVTEGGPTDFGERRYVVLDDQGGFVRCSEISPVRIGAVDPPVIADLDADGAPEIVVRTTAWDEAGARLWSQPATGIGMTTAADLDADGFMEIVTGEAVYSFDGTLRWFRPDLFIGSPAVADLDLDCVPEVIVSSRNAQAVHVVDALTGATRAWAPIPPGDCPPRSDGQGGPPTLADTDGDCIPEIGIAGCRRYALFKWFSAPDQLVELWESPTDDSSSRFTGSSIFDLEGDGTAEVLYNDHSTFRIYDAVTGAVEQQLPNTTFTLIEFPVVADADGDGRAEVLVSANDYAIGGNFGLRVLHDDAVPWVFAPPLFSSHSFHVTNILPDGRVPVLEEPSWARYNTFRVQGPPLRSIEGPVILGVPPDATVSCASVPAPALPTASGGCGDVPAVAFNETSSGGACGQIVRTWSATDRCGRVTTETQVLTVQDTAAPLLAGVPADAALACDAPTPPATVTASDACDPAPSLTVDTVDTPGPCVRTLRRTWTGLDACGNSATATQLVTFTDATPPVLAGVPADVTLACDAPTPPATVTATDACDPAPALALGEVTSPNPCGRTLTRTWTATDRCGLVTSAVQVVTFVDSSPPVLAGVPADVTLPCNAPTPPATVTATDACDPAPALALGEVTTPTPCGRTLTRTWTATDACGLVTTAVQVVTFVDASPPVLAGVPADVTLACDAPTPPATVTATDACDPAPAVATSEVTTPTPCGRTVQRTWTATDACGLVATASQVITFVDSVGPTFAGVPGDVTVTCAAVPPPATPTATDGCSTPFVAFAEIRIDGPCPDRYRLERTWTATDACGNATSRSQAIVVVDDGPPRFSGVPADVTVECDAVPAPATPTATDSCDPSPVISFRETRIDGACPSQYDLVRTWTATDRCGGIATATQVVHVVDTTPPVISGTESRCLWSPNHWMACFPASEFHPSVADACGGAVSWRFAGCASDQPEDALGDGAFAPDCIVDADGTLCVRSERQGMIPPGRHYGVLAVAVDACGNTSAPALIADVWVPRDQREHPDCLKIQDVGGKGHGRP